MRSTLRYSSKMGLMCKRLEREREKEENEVAFCVHLMDEKQFHLKVS